jgi:dephospho-CoA kinase
MSKTVIMLCGSAGSGKDTSFNFIKKHMSKSIDISHFSFGRALKEIVVDLCKLFLNENYSFEEMDNYGYKEKVRPENTIYPLDNENGEPLVIRKLLQIIGTDILRKQLGDDIFAKIILNKIDTLFKTIMKEQIVCITDLRFPNEQKCIVDYCKNNGYKCITIYIRRSVTTSDTYLHTSEKQYEQLEKDIIIENCGSLVDLETECINVIQNII